MVRVSVIREVGARIGLLVASVCLSLGLAEIAARVWKGESLAPRNFLRERRDLLQTGYPAQHDPLLGWVPREGASGRAKAWGAAVTILPNTLRSNGEITRPATMEHPRVLAVGDSFTFGDEASDDQTWPARLQQLSGYPVFNGGVFGYGLDQTVLRAEALWGLLRPDVLVVSFIDQDVLRCELLRYAGLSKPIFFPKGRALELRNVPTGPFPSGEIDWLRSALGHSFLAYRLGSRWARGWWLDGAAGTSQGHHDGYEVARRLMERLGEKARTNGTRVIVLAQYTRWTDSESCPEALGARLVLSHARRAGLEIVDMCPDLLAIRGRDATAFRQLYKEHMSAAGNELVAAVVYRAIQAPSTRAYRMAGCVQESERAKGEGKDPCAGS